MVLSGGLTPLIEATLEKLIGNKPSDIEVVANSVIAREGYRSMNEDGGAWRVQFRDDSIYGNDKAQAIKAYVEDRETMDDAEKPIFLFAGDGISDLGAAGNTDLLFAKHGKGTSTQNVRRSLFSPTDLWRSVDLVQFCIRHRLPFTEFKDWGCILKTTQDLL